MKLLIGALICYQNVPQLCVLCVLCGVKRHKYMTFLILNYGADATATSPDIDSGSAINA